MSISIKNDNVNILASMSGKKSTEGMEETNTAENVSGQVSNSLQTNLPSGDHSPNNEEIDLEEDVPGDFFDDFLKEDFMEGLDIVDDDEWDEEKNKTDLENKNSSKASDQNVDSLRKKKKLKYEKIDHVQMFRRPSKEKRNKYRKEKHESKERKPAKKFNKDKLKEKSIDADEFDIRRDPEKTKRDIERDKAKCEKDKEKRIISEKLNLVETGLVPPGMEMEIDIEEIKQQRVLIELNKPPRDLREHLNQKKLKSKSKSPKRRQRTPSKMQRSAVRKSVSPLKKTSKRRRSRSLKKSPIRKSPGRRSPRKSPSSNSQKRNATRVSPPRRSPFTSRRSSEHILHDRSFGRVNSRRSRSKSPRYRIQRYRYSPNLRRARSGSRVSDREDWLRRRRRSRSRTPKRKREEKKSFLQEIAEKLNETRPQHINIVPPLPSQMHFVHQPIGQPLSQPIGQPMPRSMGPLLPQSIQTPAPVPTPVPAPTNPTPYFRSQTQPQSQSPFDQYDQSFFIGSQQSAVPTDFAGQIQMQMQQSQATSSVNFIQNQIPLNPLSIQAVKRPFSASPTVSKNDWSKPLRTQGIIAGGKEDFTQLFQDKKITLSEFLAITAKPEVNTTSPIHLREKIKVITRCQEALKFLGSGEKKYSGKFIVHPTNNYKVLEKKFLSPLLKAPVVTFPFTQVPHKWEQKANFTNFINQLLQKIGVMKEIVVDVEDTFPSPNKPAIQRELSPPPPPSIKQNNFVHSEMSKVRLQSKSVSKMCQTDIFKCESCEKRKKLLYKTAAVQAGEHLSLFSVSTQVNEEDFYPKAKPQSLASLTPAQLLAHSRPVGEPQNSRFGRFPDNDVFDILPNKGLSARANFSQFGNYDQLRQNTPDRGSPPLQYVSPQEQQQQSSLIDMFMFNPSRDKIFGGGGRGRENQPGPSRNMDRFNYNHY